jgi:hypothetical protein
LKPFILNLKEVKKQFDLVSGQDKTPIPIKIPTKKKKKKLKV